MIQKSSFNSTKPLVVLLIFFILSIFIAIPLIAQISNASDVKKIETKKESIVWDFSEFDAPKNVTKNVPEHNNKSKAELSFYGSNSLDKLSTIDKTGFSVNEDSIIEGIPARNYISFKPDITGNFSFSFISNKNDGSDVLLCSELNINKKAEFSVLKSDTSTASNNFCITANNLLANHTYYILFVSNSDTENLVINSQNNANLDSTSKENIIGISNVTQNKYFAKILNLSYSYTEEIPVIDNKTTTTSSLPVTSIPNEGGARHIMVNGNLYLGGEYIEVGISPHGSFGAIEPIGDNAGFHPAYDSDFPGCIGFVYNQAGWSSDIPPTTGDHFLPGTPEERYIISYRDSAKQYDIPIADATNCYDPQQFKVEPAVEDLSSGDIAKAKVTGLTKEDIYYELTYSFGVYDKNFNVDVYLENKGSHDLTSIRFCRSYDPDPDFKIYNNYNTFNKVTSNAVSTKPGGNKNFSRVASIGAISEEGDFLQSYDNRARASYAPNVEYSAPISAYYDYLYDSAPVTEKTYTTKEDMIPPSKGGEGWYNLDLPITLTVEFGPMHPGENNSTSYQTAVDVGTTISPEATSSTQIIVNDVDFDFEYALFLGDETIVDYETPKSDTIVYDGLKNNTIYTIKARRSGELIPSSQSDIMTWIDPTVTEDGEEIIISKQSRCINLENADDNYMYTLLNEDGTTKIDYISPVEGNLVFEGLDPDTKYFIKAKTELNRMSEEIEVTTLLHDVYNIIVNNDGNGSATSSEDSAEAGTEISLTATPNEGFELKEWETVSPKDLEIINDKFIMPESNVEVTAHFSEIIIPDPQQEEIIPVEFYETSETSDHNIYIIYMLLALVVISGVVLFRKYSN